MRKEVLTDDASFTPVQSLGPGGNQHRLRVTHQAVGTLPGSGLPSRASHFLESLERLASPQMIQTKNYVNSMFTVARSAFCGRVRLAL